jgi:peptidyl-prolyl cis-trans isomerase D
VIESHLVNEKAHELAQAQAQKQFNTLLSLKNNAQAIENAMAWEYKLDATRSTTSISPEILTGAFAIAWPSSETAPAVKLVQIDNGDVAILWLKEVENGDIAKLSQEEKDNFRMQMTKHSGELEFAMYATSLFRFANVKKY